MANPSRRYPSPLRTAILALAALLACRALPLPTETFVPAPVAVATHETDHCHEGTAHDSRDDDTPASSSCQIHCGIAAAPFLAPPVLAVAVAAANVEHDSFHPLHAGIALPPDHPPPIA